MYECNQRAAPLLEAAEHKGRGGLHRANSRGASLAIGCTNVQMLTDRSRKLKQQGELDAQAEQRMGESLGRRWRGFMQHRCADAICC